MDFRVIWNDLCLGIKEERINKDEKFIQIFIEGIFGRLGWSLSEKEIRSREKIQKGRMPDIIIAKNEKYAFVVELKKPNINSDKYINQLLDYMSSLKLSFGILLGDSLKVYYKIPGDNDQFCKIKDFVLQKDNSEGIEFLGLLNKNEFSLEKLRNFCENNKTEIIILEGKSKENKNLTIPARLEDIWVYLKDEENSRKGIRYKMGYPKKDSKLGYEYKKKGFEITISKHKSYIKLYDNTKDETWYNASVQKIKEYLSKPEFRIDISKITCKGNIGLYSEIHFGIYIPLDNFNNPKDNPPTPENILNILTEVNKVMEYETY